MPAINRPAPAAAKRPSSTNGALTSSQKAAVAIAAVLLGPAIVKKIYDKPPEKVDLSSFNVVTHYDKPAIEKLDSTLRIEFCSS